MYNLYSFLTMLDSYSELFVCSSLKLAIYRNVIITQTKVHRETQFLAPSIQLHNHGKENGNFIFWQSARISSPLLFNRTDGFLQWIKWKRGNFQYPEYTPFRCTQRIRLPLLVNPLGSCWISFRPFARPFRICVIPHFTPKEKKGRLSSVENTIFRKCIFCL